MIDDSKQERSRSAATRCKIRSFHSLVFLSGGSKRYTGYASKTVTIPDETRADCLAVAEGNHSSIQLNFATVKMIISQAGRCLHGGIGVEPPFDDLSSIPTLHSSEVFWRMSMSYPVIICDCDFD